MMKLVQNIVVGRIDNNVFIGVKSLDHYVFISAFIAGEGRYNCRFAVCGTIFVFFFYLGCPLTDDNIIYRSLNRFKVSNNLMFCFFNLSIESVDWLTTMAHCDTSI